MRYRLLTDRLWTRWDKSEADFKTFTVSNDHVHIFASCVGDTETPTQWRYYAGGERVAEPRLRIATNVKGYGRAVAMIPLHKVAYLGFSHKYTSVFTTDGKEYIDPNSLTTFCKSYPEFVKAHRNLAVRLCDITGLECLDGNNQWGITLRDNPEWLPVGRRAKVMINKYLKGAM